MKNKSKYFSIEKDILGRTWVCYKDFPDSTISKFCLEEVYSINPRSGQTDSFCVEFKVGDKYILFENDLYQELCDLIFKSTGTEGPYR